MTANIVSRALSKRGPGNASANFQHEERCGSILSEKLAACFVRLRSGANTIAERVKVERWTNLMAWDRARVLNAELP
jgi:hypothetical protein